MPGGKIRLSSHPRHACSPSRYSNDFFTRPMWLLVFASRDCNPGSILDLEFCEVDGQIGVGFSRVQESEDLVEARVH